MRLINISRRELIQERLHGLASRRIRELQHGKEVYEQFELLKVASKSQRNKRQRFSFALWYRTDQRRHTCLHDVGRQVTRERFSQEYFDLGASSLLQDLRSHLSSVEAFWRKQFISRPTRH